ncbi:MAG: cbb3-type cytochrome c oxidase subunit II [Nitrospirae bacterium]|nr:cbb3-type cytochrome c oxidase subunit II [Nitrospirota bacterium]
MAFREYRIGVVCIGIVFASAISLTILFPTMELAQITPTPLALQKMKDYGPETAWSLKDPFMQGAAAPTTISRGRTVFIREGCWWCHTLLPEQTQDWAYFGAPPVAGDVVGESPTVFGSDRKAPDLLHVGSRLPAKVWHIMHHKSPRSLQPKSIMPNFDYLSDEDLGAVADYMLSLK